MRGAAARPAQRREQRELRRVGVLELVDEHVAPAPAIAGADRRVFSQQPYAVRHEVGEVKRVGARELEVDELPQRPEPRPLRCRRADVDRRSQPALGERDLLDDPSGTLSRRIPGVLVVVGEQLAHDPRDVALVIDAERRGAREDVGV